MFTGLQPGDPSAIGPYRLVGRLGQGGMGQVFLGVSRGGRPVAVKAIRTELAADPQFRTRFGREIAAARKVSGVFTAMVVDADVDGPVAWLATAYVPGPSLAEAVHGHGPLPEGSLLALAAGLAESLTAIHAAGVVHQDLKPSNVLLAEDGPRVIDFGISRVAESAALTQTTWWPDRPGSCPPSRFWAARLDRRATSSAWGRCSCSPPLARDRSARERRRRCCTASCMNRPALAGCRLRCGRWSSAAWPRIRRTSHSRSPAGRGGRPPAQRELAA